MPKIQASTALSHFKVVDLSRVRAGPACVRVLTDFGADVVRVEPPKGVDPNEALFADKRDGGDFQNLNRNKRSLTLNLKKPGALDILKRMIVDADVVGHDVDDQPQAASAGGARQAGQPVGTTQFRRDGRRIGHVVAVCRSARRGEDGGQVEVSDAELVEIGQQVLGVGEGERLATSWTAQL